MCKTMHVAMQHRKSIDVKTEQKESEKPSGSMKARLGNVPSGTWFFWRMRNKVALVKAFQEADVHSLRLTCILNYIRLV